MFRLAVIALSAASALVAAQIGFVQTNLASDVPGAAQSTDPDLVNAWGMAAHAALPRYGSAPTARESPCFTAATGVKQGLVVTIPGDGSVTGVSFSNLAGSFNGDTFLFDNEDGTVSGWRAALGTTRGNPGSRQHRQRLQRPHRCDHRRHRVRVSGELPQRRDRRIERQRGSSALDRKFHGPESAGGICAVRRAKPQRRYLRDVCRSGLGETRRCRRPRQRHRGRIRSAGQPAAAGWSPTARSTRRGDWRWRRQASEMSAATCWWAISATA